MMLAAVALVLAIFQAGAPPAAQPATAQMSFVFENPQLDPASYTLLFREDGSGHYQSVPGSAPADPQGVASVPLSRDIQLQDPLRSTLFQVARTHRFFAITCEAPHSHIAFTGKKTISYAGSDGSGECTFNWSRDQQLNELADNLMAVAFTLEEGRRLVVQHQHSRLSLDSELEMLEAAVKGGRALEIENIAPELQSIANDEAVLNRARKRAVALLNGAASKPASGH
jgi:hypothetical protein